MTTDASASDPHMAHKDADNPWLATGPAAEANAKDIQNVIVGAPMLMTQIGLAMPLSAADLHYALSQILFLMYPKEHYHDGVTAPASTHLFAAAIVFRRLLAFINMLRKMNDEERSHLVSMMTAIQDPNDMKMADFIAKSPLYEAADGPYFDRDACVIINQNAGIRH